MSFRKNVAAAAAMIVVCSSASAFAQGEAMKKADSMKMQNGTMVKSGGMMSKKKPVALGTGNDRTTMTGGNSGGRADRN